MLTVILGGGGGGGGGGERNRGAKCPVTHEVGHMLGGSGGMLPQKMLRFFTLCFLQYEQQFTQLCSKSF